MRALLLAITTALLLSIAWTWHRPPPTLASRLGPAPGAADFRVLVVYQERDCDDSLAAVRLLQQAQLDVSLSVSGAFDGTPTALAAAHARLSERGLDLPSGRLGRDLRRALLRLGYRRTPFMVVLDREGRVRLATHVPRDIAGMTALFDILNHLDDGVRETTHEIPSDTGGNAPVRGLRARES